MKRFVSSVLACAMALGMCACTDKAKNVKDGTFSGSGKGYGGNLVADVTFSNGAITKIEIQEEHETKTWAASALENIPKYIISAQSINTDTISGATVTSKGIQEAVSSAIQQAHGDIQEWNSDSTGKHHTKEVEKEADVVIVGGGISGMTAALRLQQLGKSCIVVEKNSELGGVLYYGGSYSQLYKDEGTQDIEIGNTTFDTILETNLSDTVDWQKKVLGVVFEEEGTVRNYAEGNENIGELLSREVQASGAEVLLDTCVTGIEEDNGSIIGVSAIDKDGKLYHITGEDVILASGSASSLYPYNSDDLLSIAKDAGYQVQGYHKEDIQSCVDLENGQVVDAYYAIQKSMKSPMILVNENGERISIEESGRVAFNHALGNKNYLVMDASAYKKWKSYVLKSVVGKTDDDVSIDTLKSVYHFDSLEQTCKQAGIDYETLVKTLHAYNDVATDIFGREITVGFNDDSDIFIVKLCSGSYESAGGIVIHKDLHVVDHDGNSVAHLYAIGNCANALDGVVEGSENAWAFVSGKMVADALSEE